MFFSWKLRASDLKASKNKPHQIRVLEFQAKEHSRTSAVQEHLQASSGAATSSPISTLMQPVSLKTQNMKVVELYLGVSQHLESSQSEPG